MLAVRGFSLVELMVAVAIVAALALIATPSFRDSVARSRRADAAILLLGAAQHLERCRSECTSFTAACNDACPMTLPRTSPAGLYVIAADRSTITADSFRLVARPVAGMPQARDGGCSSFWLTHSGARGATGSTPAACWR